MFHKTYIIIVTYNAMPWLNKCLGSIDFQKYKVVVVDNNSKDETTDVISKDYPQIDLYKESKNLGFGQANNKGISEAINQGADYVYLLNQDAYLYKDTVSQLININQKYPEYGVLSPIHTNAEFTKLDRNFSNYVRYDMNPHFYSDFVLNLKKKDVYEVPFVNAAGWLISKKCLMNVGGFDPIFFHYGEDRNYAQRILYQDFKIGIVPSAFMVHDRESRKKVEIQKYSDEYFDEKEKLLKVKYADLNKKNFCQLKREIKACQSRIIKNRIKLKFKQVNILKKELFVLKKIKSEIIRSVEMNKIKQPNYLNIENI